jgi:hypothetical protein
MAQSWCLVFGEMTCVFGVSVSMLVKFSVGSIINPNPIHELNDMNCWVLF